MSKFFIVIFLLLQVFVARAGKRDSLFVSEQSGHWVLIHKIKQGETPLSIARFYNVPLHTLSKTNAIRYDEQLAANSELIVPLDAYNFLSVKPSNSDAKPVYLKINNEPFYKIARISGVSQKQLQDWNALPTNEIHKGQVLLVGWVRLDDRLVAPAPVKSSTTNSRIKVEEFDPFNNPQKTHTEIFVVTLPDTTVKPEDTLSEGAIQYNEQTYNGSTVTEEKGAAVFFKRAGRSDNGIYFALHNTAKRGTIIRIYNPGNDKTVYAKVIGTIPVRDIFHNALIGLSSDAKSELEAGGEKVWCEISYAP